MMQTALKDPYLIVVIALAVTVLVYVSYQKIPADLLPMYDTPAVQIVTFYLGILPFGLGAFSHDPRRFSFLDHLVHPGR